MRVEEDLPLATVQKSRQGAVEAKKEHLLARFVSHSIHCGLQGAAKAKEAHLLAQQEGMELCTPTCQEELQHPKAGGAR